MNPYNAPSTENPAKPTAARTKGSVLLSLFITFGVLAFLFVFNIVAIKVAAQNHRLFTDLSLSCFRFGVPILAIGVSVLIHNYVRSLSVVAFVAGAVLLGLFNHWLITEIAASV